MATFIKRVPKFEARAYTGLGAIPELADLAGSNFSPAGYRVESHHTGPILYIKTTDFASCNIEESDICMEVGQVLVCDEAGALTVMSGEDFTLQYEAAP